jgi:hypothetical protein
MYFSFEEWRFFLRGVIFDFKKRVITFKNSVKYSLKVEIHSLGCKLIEGVSICLGTLSF